MANPGSFGDLGKDAKEALLRGRDFSTKPTVELTSTSKNNVKATAKIHRENNGSLVGSLEFKLPKTNGVESSVTLDSLNKVKLSASSTDQLVKGLKATLAVEADVSKNDKLVKTTAEYKRPRVTASATFAFPWRAEAKPGDKGASIVSALVLGLAEYGVTAGLESEYLLAAGALDSFSSTLQYRHASFVSTAFARGKGAKSLVVGGSFYSRFTNPALSNAEAAAEIAYETKADADNVTVTLGGAYDISKESRLSAAVDTHGKLLAQVAHTVNSGTKLKFGTETQLKADASPKYFVGLAFTD